MILKSIVYKYDDYWVAELDWVTWADRTDFSDWDKALDHALWLGLCAGVWSHDGR